MTRLLLETGTEPVVLMRREAARQAEEAVPPWQPFTVPLGSINLSTGIADAHPAEK
jgi:hypothetical protein